MPIDSRTLPEETSALAATAAAMIDAALSGSGLSRDAYWAAVRKGYNTPYNDPPRTRPAPASASAPLTIVLAEPEATPPLPVAAMVPQALAEFHAV
ncbi:hypothetical protein [uncultured Methylobacterium sp.]|uniref:hypothetical protein n=1 Tax=uncultured Methylobacterium sp. TaxID=157278 RepID=UPI0035CACB82